MLRSAKKRLSFIQGNGDDDDEVEEEHSGGKRNDSDDDNDDEHNGVERNDSDHFPKITVPFFQTRFLVSNNPKF